MNRMMFEPEREDALYLHAYDSHKQVLYIYIYIYIYIFIYMPVPVAARSKE